VFVLSLVEALLKELCLYGERRSSALDLEDRDLAAELTRTVHGYLGLEGRGR
jgi:hypothetical protein